MAARRLLIVMVMLLVISTVVALLAPDPNQREESAERADEAEEPAVRPGWRSASGAAGEAVVRRIAVGDRPSVLRLRVGDHLTLLVGDRGRRQIEIPELGLIETPGAGAPARFDVYLARPSRFEIFAGSEAEPIATLAVARDAGARVPTPARLAPNRTP